MYDLTEVGKFITSSETDSIEIDIHSLKIGINNLEDHIIKLKEDKTVEYVINKICDHAGGRLVIKRW